jgi:hypothetical protein
VEALGGVIGKINGERLAGVDKKSPEAAGWR